MKFSDAVELGLTRVTVTGKGPDFEHNDPWMYAFYGVYGKPPSGPDLAVFYHENSTGVQFGTDAEHAVRILLTHKVTWREFLAALREYGL